MRLLVLLLVACGSAGPSRPTASPATRQAYAARIVPPMECRAPGPDSLDQAAMSRDVAELRDLFRRGYAGYPDVMHQDAWRSTFDGINAELPPQASPAEFRDHLADRLQAVDDNHVGFWTFNPHRSWRSTSGHAGAYVSEPVVRAEAHWRTADGREIERCALPDEPDHEVRVVRSFGEAGPSFRFRALTRAEPASLECVDASGEATALPLTPVSIDHGRGPAVETIEAPFPWLRLRSLMTTHAGALEAFVGRADELRTEPLVVVDMRHAGGGSDRYLRRFFDGFAHQPLAYWQTGTLRSETMLQGALNFWSCIRAAQRTRDPAGRAWLDARIERAERELRTALETRGLFHEIVRQDQFTTPRAAAPFEGRIVLVVDRGCMSACETSVLLARQIPGTIVVGENTGGVMKVGELRWYRLPESRVWVSLGHRSHGDPENRFREAYGFEPDIWLPGGDTEAKIRRLAECAQDPECAASLSAPTP